MSCILTNVKTGESLIAIEKLQCIKFENGKIIINRIVEFEPNEILEIRYKRNE